MTCRVQADPAAATSSEVAADRLELIELSCMANDRPQADPPSSSRSATVKIRFGAREEFGQYAAATRMLDVVSHAMMNAVHKLGLFVNGEEPVMTIFEVRSCHPGFETEGTFLVTLEYRGQSRTVRLRDADLVTGSRRVVLDALNALLCDEDVPELPSSAASGEDAEFIGCGSE